MSGYVIGVDPGIKGGVALVGPDALTMVDWFFMPTMVRSTGRGNQSVVDAPAAAQALDKMIAKVSGHPSNRVAAVIERVSAMPQQGIASAFNFGHNAGMIEAVVRCNVGSVSVVSPSQWKREMNLGRDKAQAIAMARDRFGPHQCFQHKTKDGVAEAALLAAYWLKTNRV